MPGFTNPTQRIPLSAFFSPNPYSLLADLNEDANEAGVSANPVKSCVALQKNKFSPRVFWAKFDRHLLVEGKHPEIVLESPVPPTREIFDPLNSLAGLTKCKEQPKPQVSRMYDHLRIDWNENLETSAGYVPVSDFSLNSLSFRPDRSEIFAPESYGTAYTNYTQPFALSSFYSPNSFSTLLDLDEDGNYTGSKSSAPLNGPPIGKQKLQRRWNTLPTALQSFLSTADNSFKNRIYDLIGNKTVTVSQLSHLVKRANMENYPLEFLFGSSDEKFKYFFHPQIQTLLKEGYWSLKTVFNTFEISAFAHPHVVEAFRKKTIDLSSLKEFGLTKTYCSMLNYSSAPTARLLSPDVLNAVTENRFTFAEAVEQFASDGEPGLKALLELTEPPELVSISPTDLNLEAQPTQLGLISSVGSKISSYFKSINPFRASGT